MSKEVTLTFRCFVYEENDGSFTGVCLDLDIIEEDHTTLQEAVLSLNEAVDAHLQVAEKFKYPNTLICRPAPQEYWDKLAELSQEKKPLKDTSFRFFGATFPGLSYGSL